MTQIRGVEVGRLGYEKSPRRTEQGAAYCNPRFMQRLRQSPKRQRQRNPLCRSPPYRRVATFLQPLLNALVLASSFYSFVHPPLNIKMSTEEVNPYELLGLSIEATEQEIKTAYRQRSLKVHPDRVSICSLSLFVARELNVVSNQVRGKRTVVIQMQVRLCTSYTLPSLNLLTDIR